MSKKRFLAILGIIALICGLAVLAKLFFLQTSIPTVGAIQVDAVPKSQVFLEGNKVGQTPYLNEKLKIGEYQLQVGDWQGKIKISPGTLTYISRELSPFLEKSAGQVLTLEKLPTNEKSEIAVISDPGEAIIIVDGLEKGKTSLVLRDLPAGNHTIVISLNGYADQVVQAKLVLGYRLNAIVKLGKIDKPEIVNIETPVTASPSAYLTVKETPTGFLRIRSLPDLSASISGTIKPGEKYPILEESSGWAKIKVGNLEGWVWESYVEITR